MIRSLVRKISAGFQGLPNILEGYPLAANRQKFRLIDRVFRDIAPGSTSFADLGGVWRVEAAYTIYTLKTYPIRRAVLVDTNISPALEHRLRTYPNLQVVRGDFGDQAMTTVVGPVDVIYLFDVLLHQVNPDWHEILRRYAPFARFLVIYNQQYVSGKGTVRLTDLSLQEYSSIVPRRRDDLYRFVYDHASELHPEYRKPWKDVHNIWQWGITDEGLRSVMAGLGYKERWFGNYGMFSELPAFENHAFVFQRRD